ncbi:hypothetical protein HMI54_011798, partial [Coelomomyces lativittatus]
RSPYIFLSALVTSLLYSLYLIVCLCMAAVMLSRDPNQPVSFQDTRPSDLTWHIYIGV